MPPCRQRGLSLLEVLIAAATLLAAIPGIDPLVGRSGANVRDRESTSVASHLKTTLDLAPEFDFGRSRSPTMPPKAGHRPPDPGV